MLQFTDITAFRILCAPDDGSLILDQILTDLTTIHDQKGTLYSSQYAFTDLEIAQAMNACWVQMPGIGLFDASCDHDSHVNHEAIVAATQNIDSEHWAVGTMPDNMIVHDKLYCDPITGLVFTGSFNITASAAKEANNALFITSKSMAVFYAEQIEKNLPIVKEHVYKLPAAATTAATAAATATATDEMLDATDEMLDAEHEE